MSFWFVFKETKFHRANNRSQTAMLIESRAAAAAAAAAGPLSPQEEAIGYAFNRRRY